jgi:ribosome biogenesis GTPase / thiamine phosphate phosphatase
MDLSELGWDSKWEAIFDEYRSRRCVPGRVAMEEKHSYWVLVEGGESEAQVPGRMLHRTADRADLPKVGDWVALRGMGGAGPAVVEAVLPRRTFLARKVAGRQVLEQVLVANVDRALVVAGLDAPAKLRRLERFLVMAREGGVAPVVVLNKADLCDEADGRVEEVRGVARGAPVLVTSARTGLGLRSLRDLIGVGETAVMVGASGVGKSSLINRLYGTEVQPTGEVRERDAKGRHVTSWREMTLVPGGGLVIDTPGVRELHLWDAWDGLQDEFGDLEELSVRCHFPNCSHRVEARCAVRSAVECGEVERLRYESYLKLKAELAELEAERRQHRFQGRRERRPTSRVEGGRRGWRGGLEDGDGG